MAEGVVKAAGGRRALDKVRYLRFDFVLYEGGKVALRRTHLWDRETGRYRLSGHDPQGLPYVTLFNTRTGQGKSYHARPVADEGKALRESVAAYVNDTFWLLAPLRLRDPGTHRETVGELPLAGRNYPALTVWFDAAAGPVPHARDWYYIDEATGRPQGWSFLLKGQPEGGQPATFLWTKWLPVGKLTLPVRFEEVGGTRVIVLENIFTPAVVGDNVFESVSAPMLDK